MVALTVLVVDDTDSARDVAIRILRFYGIQATGAHNGQECLTILKHSRPDLILLDIAMPEMDGLAVLERLMQDPQCADIPVVMMTAIADSESVGRALHLGAREYLVKAEFTAPKVLEVVRRHACHNTGPAEADAASH